MPIQHRHAQVEKDQARTGCGEELERIGPVDGSMHRVACFGQHEHQEVAQHWRVFHHEDAPGLTHGQLPFAHCLIGT